MSPMVILLYISILLLFLSFHIGINIWFIESQAIFYITSTLTILLSLFYMDIPVFSKKGNLSIVFLFLFLLGDFLIRGNEYGDFSIYSLLFCWMLFFVFQKLFYHKRYFRKYLLWLIVLGVYVEILLGLGQILGFIENNDNFFVLGGSLNNPGAYAGYLSVVSPFILSQLLVYRKNCNLENEYYLLLICLIFSYYLIIMSYSRGAWIACFLGSLYVLSVYYGFKERSRKYFKNLFCKIIVLLGLVLFISIILYVLFSLRVDSAFGRLLIWKVSVMRQDFNLLMGEGFGAFGANYGHWQADYFEFQGSDAERFVADYVTFAYNELLHIGVEQGFVGIILWIIVFIFAFKRKNIYYSRFITGAKASLISTLILSCVSYPFSIDLIYFHLIICLAILYDLCEMHSFDIKSPLRIFEKFTYSGLALLIFIFGINNLQGIYWLRKGQNAVFRNRIEKSIDYYNKADEKIKNNGAFLFNYALALALSEKYELSIEKLKEASRKSSNPNILLLLGDNYKKIAYYKEAKNAYLRAVYCVPSKLYPKYQLMQLFVELNQEKEACFWAKEILSTKIKLQTDMAEKIQNEANAILKISMFNINACRPMEK